MKATLFFYFLMGISAQLFSQAPEIEWQNTIGGNLDDILISLKQTSDKGYILGGWSYSTISGDKTEATLGEDDYWVIKLDSMGSIEWQNTIGGNSYDELISIQQTADGGYILGGSSYSNVSGDKTESNMGAYFTNDYWVVKLDESGNIEWQNTIGGSSYDYLHSIQQTADGGYILGGSSFSSISGDKTEAKVGGDDYWVVKLDSAGAIEWQNTIGGSSYDYLSSISQTSDGGYILGGISNSGVSGDKTEANIGGSFTYYDYWVVKLDNAGDIEWQNTIGGSSSDYLYSISQASDGGYILAGYSNSGISEDKTEASKKGGYDYWVVKLDNAGDIEWQNTIGGSSNDYLYSISQTSDGGYILGGYSYSGISGDKTEAKIGGYDYWVVKLYPEGIAGCAMPSSFISNPLITQAKLQWNEVGAVKYRVRYKPVGAIEWQYDYASDGKNYVVLNDLTCNTEYEWGVKTICATDGSISSEYSASSFFTTGACRLGDDNQNTTFNIYPNPATNEFTVNFALNNSAGGKVFMNIYNLVGETVYTKELPLINGTLSERIVLGNVLPGGVYIVKLKTADDEYIQELIIQK